MDLYTIGCTIEPPVVWYIQKCMLIWKICFYFSFVVCDVVIKKTTRHVMRPPFTEKGLNVLPQMQLGLIMLTDCLKSLNPNQAFVDMMLIFQEICPKFQ